jgi:hypothetical protein
MKRSFLVAALAVLLGPACKTAGPPASSGPPALPAPLAEYEGEMRILLHQGDQKAVEARPGKPLSGGCDIAVHVRSVALDKGAARFSLDTVGLPKVRGQAPDCKRAQPGLMLTVSGLTGAEAPEELRARVDGLLETPVAYLASKGIDFDLPEGEAPTVVASSEVFSGADERTLGRQVGTWPKALLTVDPWYHDGSDRIHQEGEIELVAVVGTDGRLYDPEVKTGLSSSQQLAVLRVLPLWRFEPARGKDGAVGARVLLRPLLRVF